MPDDTPGDRDAEAAGVAAFSHLDAAGRARMVDVSGKAVTLREARARAIVRMQPSTLQRLVSGTMPKGDVFTVARIAGIQAAKRTGELIPLCHPLPIDEAEVLIDPDLATASVVLHARVRTTGRTGVEMEALTAVSVAALTIYDMCKAVDRAMAIESIVLLEKLGGRSGHWVREAP